MNLSEYTGRDQMMEALAHVIATGLARCLEQLGRASLAVPGGTTPGPIFDVLSNVKLDWARIDVMLTDERWVAENNPRSNTALLRKRLLVGQAAAANLVPLYGGTPTPEGCLEALSNGVKSVLPLTVVLLGMGDDMHTASLFPGADKLSDALSPDAPPLLAMRAPNAPEPRVTLSAVVLNGAMEKHLVITGDAKRAALHRAIDLPAELAPVRAVMQDLNVHWAP